MTKLILFNGPPSAGKDTAFLALWNEKELRRAHFLAFNRMSMPIKRAFASMMNANIDAFGNVEHFEKTKNEIIPILRCSYRQWQIDFSEKFMKPLYGDNIFSRLCVARIQRYEAAYAHIHDRFVILIPDCGFPVELETLSNAFGRENIFLWKIIRPSFTFAGDSRMYLPEPNATIYNDGTIEHFESTIIQETSQWLSRS